MGKGWGERIKQKRRNPVIASQRRGNPEKL